LISQVPKNNVLALVSDPRSQRGKMLGLYLRDNTLRARELQFLSDHLGNKICMRQGQVVVVKHTRRGMEELYATPWKLSSKGIMKSWISTPWCAQCRTSQPSYVWEQIWSKGDPERGRGSPHLMWKGPAYIDLLSWALGILILLQIHPPREVAGRPKNPQTQPDACGPGI
jgi:hypothetical protein